LLVEPLQFLSRIGVLHAHAAYRTPSAGSAPADSLRALCLLCALFFLLWSFSQRLCVSAVNSLPAKRAKLEIGEKALLLEIEKPRDQARRAYRPDGGVERHAGLLLRRRQVRRSRPRLCPRYRTRAAGSRHRRYRRRIHAARLGAHFGRRGDAAAHPRPQAFEGSLEHPRFRGYLQV